MKKVIIIQARMSSSRLPGKTLLNLQDRPVLDWVIRAASEIRGADQVVVATSKDSSDDPIVKHCREQNVAVFRGDLDDVLGRFYYAAREFQAEAVMRITADCPFFDPEVGTSLFLQLETIGCDYISNTVVPTFPDGLDCEVFLFSALERAFHDAKTVTQREHVTQYFLQNRSLFNVQNFECPIPNLHHERWTLDTAEDLKFLDQVARELNHSRAPRYDEILRVLRAHPNIKEAGKRQTRNEGLSKSKNADLAKRQPFEFKKSTSLLERAEKRIPIGSQTFSKSRTQYPVGFAPLFASHGQGAHIWDVDGNEYVDLVNGLLPNVLGYADEDVNRAIEAQLSRGITLSLATELEIQLAEKLAELIPCAEMARFGKNGTDATSGCIRISRAFTSRDKVLVCGYHGWQDWYIGSTTRNKGVPKAVQELTLQVPYNDIAAVEKVLESNKGQIACMIMEATNFAEPKPGYFAELKELLHRHGTLLVFDEIITGFRLSLGGAQKYFGVTPDLASFGKSMGNGMPISAVVGRRDIMKEMEEVFFSGTFGGETLSLAASLAVIEKMKRENVIEALWSKGADLRRRITATISEFNLEKILGTAGLDPWHAVTFKGFRSDESEEPVEAIKTYFLHQLHSRGVLTVGTHNICYAHSTADWDWVDSAYRLAAEALRRELDLSAAGRGTLAERMAPLPVVRPLFRVR